MPYVALLFIIEENGHQLNANAEIVKASIVPYIEDAQQATLNVQYMIEKRFVYESYIIQYVDVQVHCGTLT